MLVYSHQLLQDVVCTLLNTNLNSLKLCNEIILFFNLRQNSRTGKALQQQYDQVRGGAKLSRMCVHMWKLFTTSGTDMGVCLTSHGCVS